MGTIIAGIYEGIKLGENDVRSDYTRTTGRAHKSPRELIEAYRVKHA